MVDPKFIHDWKGLFVLMSNVTKSPIDFGSRNGVLLPKKPFPYLTKVKKRRKRGVWERDVERNSTMRGRL